MNKSIEILIDNNVNKPLFFSPKSLVYKEILGIIDNDKLEELASYGILLLHNENLVLFQKKLKKRIKEKMPLKSGEPGWTIKFEGDIVELNLRDRDDLLLACLLDIHQYTEEALSRKENLVLKLDAKDIS